MKPHNFRFFFIPYLLFLIPAVMYISVSDHGDAVLWINRNHNELLNIFFKIWTFGGNGIAFGIVAVILLIRKRRHGYVFLLVGLTQGLILWSMKKVFFVGTPRPKKYFENQQVLDLIEGVKVHDFNSFPSGHTMTAFAIATFLSLLIGKREWSVLLLVGAVLVGVSRLYLNQHFLVDIAMGSFIGVLVAVIGYHVFDKYLSCEKVIY